MKLGNYDKTTYQLYQISNRSYLKRRTYNAIGA